MNRALPFLATEKPDWFNAYQQTQGPRVEKAMLKAKYVVSFIRYDAGKALYVGLFKIGSHRPIGKEEFWKTEPYRQMRDDYDLEGWGEEEKRSTILWFDLRPVPFVPEWVGKLVLTWPPPELAWMRRAHRNTLAVFAIREESALVRPMPRWDEITLSISELRVLPPNWAVAMRQWRAIYYAFDPEDGKGYIGSAYGAENLHQRWMVYVRTGHGNNKHMRPRKGHDFRFSILERLSPDLPKEDVTAREATWKKRLHTHWPAGLNDN
ncbi:MAG: GIY-YIG nuclease family protein [Xanthobacteraceae bacterium]